MEINIFDEIDTVFNSYYSTLEIYYKYKTLFKTEIFSEWEENLDDNLKTTEQNNYTQPRNTTEEKS